MINSRRIARCHSEAAFDWSIKSVALHAPKVTAGALTVGVYGFHEAAAPTSLGICWRSACSRIDGGMLVHDKAAPTLSVGTIVDLWWNSRERVIEEGIIEVGDVSWEVFIV